MDGITWLTLRCNHSLLLCQLLSSPEAEQLAGARALGPLAGHEGLRRLVHAQLGEGDAVQGGVQLAVAAAVQAVAVALAARDRQGCDAGVHGEARRAGEALGPGRLADEAGGAEGAAARQGEEFGGELLSLIHISEPTRLGMISYAVFCLK